MNVEYEHYYIYIFVGGENRIPDLNWGAKNAILYVSRFDVEEELLYQKLALFVGSTDYFVEAKDEIEGLRIQSIVVLWRRSILGF